MDLYNIDSNKNNYKDNTSNKDSNKNNCNNNNNNIKIGVVIHGPTIIDSGCVKYIINLLNNFNFKINNKIIKPKIYYKLGGTSGRIAIIDHKLENIVDISQKLLPSKSLEILGKNSDLLILMNYGLSKETGHTFGKIVVERSNIINKTIIQIERPKEKDGSLIIWNNLKNYEKQLINYLSKNLNVSIEYGNNIKKYNNYGINIWKKNNKIYRKIVGVNKNDNILLNGISVGKALNSEIILVCENNKLINIINGNIDFKKLEQLNNLLNNNVDISKIIVKTGYLRKLNNSYNSCNYSNNCNNNVNYNKNYTIYKNNNLNNNFVNNNINVNNVNNNIKNNNLDNINYKNNINNLNNNNSNNNNNINNNNNDVINNNINNIYKIQLLNNLNFDLINFIKSNETYNYITIGNNNTFFYGDLLYRFNKKIIGITFEEKLNNNIINNPKITKNSYIFLIKNYSENEIYNLLNNYKTNFNNLKYNEIVIKLKNLFNKKNIKYNYNKI